MTGPEHLREAERLLKVADGRDGTWATYTLAVAQVHATLALAAATAEAGGLIERDDWYRAVIGGAR